MIALSRLKCVTPVVEHWLEREILRLPGVAAHGSFVYDAVLSRLVLAGLVGGGHQAVDIAVSEVLDLRGAELALEGGLDLVRLK